LLPHKPTASTFCDLLVGTARRAHAGRALAILDELEA
jgi:hypothetical protein